MSQSVYKKNSYPQIFILDASAGSGKTYNLAKQYLHLLFIPFSKSQVDSYPLSISNILAITFTNKAATEMKQRILELLKKIALNLLDEKEKNDILKPLIQTEKDEKQIVSLAEKIVNDIIQNYHYFQVRTIDSFINQIISVYSLHLGISPLFKIEEQYSEYIDYCINQLLDDYKKNKDVKKIFDEFINNYIYLEHKKSWYPKKDIFEIVRLLYEETKKYGKKYQKFMPDISVKSLSDQFINNVKKFYELLPKEKVYKKFVSAIEEFINKYSFEKKIVLPKNLSSFFTYEKIPTIKNFVVDKKIDRMWQKIRTQLKNLVELQCFQSFNCYIDIFEYVEKKLDLFLKQEDILFLSMLNKKINEIVSSDKYFVPTIFMKLAMRIKHCLIDEFQDTSILQWKNILPIIEEVLANGGSLFYVGDKKQMIYRFSGSEYTLFDNVINFFPRYMFEKKYLSTNLRSRKEIVSFNNKIFSKQNLQRFLTIIEEKEKNNVCIKEEVLNIYSNSQQNYIETNDGGYVYGELVPKENYEEEVKEKVKKIISELLLSNIDTKSRFLNDKEIAVLVRTKKEAEIVSNWLLEAGFSVESDRTLDVLENNFVKEIISLVKFLLSPNDNLSFVSFILGDIFLESSNMSYEEIYNFVFEEKKQSKESLLYQKFKQKYPQLDNRFFKPLFEAVYFFATYDFLLKISEVFNFYSLKVFHQNYPFFYKLLELAKKIEQDSCSVYYFIEKINYFTPEEKQIVAKGEKQINVMTIHKSKGLEFEVVILPFVRINIEVGKHKDFTQRFITLNNEYLQVVKLSKEMIKYSKTLSSIYYTEYKNLLIDELNVLYVAFTRAKEQIYFFVPDENNNLAKFLFEFNQNNLFIQGTQQCFNKSFIVKDKQKNMIKLEPIQHTDKLYSMVEQKIEKFEIINRQNIAEGELIHKILSFIENIYNKEVEKEVNLAIQKTKCLLKNPNRINWEIFKTKVLNIVTNKKLQHLFFIPNGKVYCEQEVVNSIGEIKRVDRIIVLSDKVIVVDYKLKFIEKIEEYKKQVEEYKKIVSQIFALPTYGYILFLDTKNLIEV